MEYIGLELAKIGSYTVNSVEAHNTYHLTITHTLQLEIRITVEMDFVFQLK